MYIGLFNEFTIDLFCIISVIYCCNFQFHSYQEKDMCIILFTDWVKRMSFMRISVDRNILPFYTAELNIENKPILDMVLWVQNLSRKMSDLHCNFVLIFSGSHI
jgi:hypothetical protein